MNDEELQEVKKEENNFQAIPVQSESLLWKTLKLGAFYALTGMTVGKLGKNSKSISKYADLITIGAVSTATLLNNDEGEENFSRDLIALGTVFGVTSGHKAFKDFLLGNEETYIKATKYADKADDFIRRSRIIASDFFSITGNVVKKKVEDMENAEIMAKRNEYSLKIFNMPYNDLETKTRVDFAFHVKKFEVEKEIGEEAIKNLTKDEIDDYVLKKDDVSFFKSFFSPIFNKTKKYSTASFETFSSGMHNLFDKKMEAVNEFYQKSEYYQYITSETKREAHNAYKSYIKNQSGSFFFNDASREKNLETAKQLFNKNERFERIARPGFFRSLLGDYSIIKDGKVEANIEEIVVSGHNYLSEYNYLYDRFLESNEVSNNLDPEIKTQAFVSWLRKNTFNSSKSLDEKDSILADKILSLYDKEADIKVEELRQFIGKKFEVKDFEKYIIGDTEHNENIKKIGGRIYKSITKDEELSDKMIDFITNSNTKISDFFEVKLIDKLDDKGKKIGEFYQVMDIKNIDIFKNFSLTDVVKKENGRLIDKTTLDGNLAVIKTMSIFENAISAFYNTNNILLPKNRLKLWNPLSLIDSKSRERQYITNNIQRMSMVRENGENFSTLLVDGMKFQTVQTKSFVGSKKLDDKTISNLSHGIKNTFFKKNEDFSVNFIKTNLDNIIDILSGTGKDIKELDKDEIEEYSKNVRKLEEVFSEVSNLNYKRGISQKLTTINNNFYTDGLKSYKNYFTKSIVSTASEEASYLKENERIISPIIKGNNFKDKIHSFFASDYNFTPFSYKYDPNTKKYNFKFNSNKDEYFKDDSSIPHFFLKRNIIKKVKEIGVPFFDDEVNSKDLEESNKLIQKGVANVLKGILNENISIDEVNEDIMLKTIDKIDKINLRGFLTNNLGNKDATRKFIENINKEEYLKGPNAISDEQAIYTLIKSSVAGKVKKHFEETGEKDYVTPVLEKALGILYTKNFLLRLKPDDNGKYDISSKNLKKFLSKMVSNNSIKINEEFSIRMLESFKKSLRKQVFEEIVEDVVYNTDFGPLKSIEKLLSDYGIKTEEIESELKGTRKLLKDYIEAMKLAKQDTYSEGKKYNKFVKYTTEILKDNEEKLKENSPLYGKLQMNISNRLYRFYEKNKEVIDNGLLTEEEANKVNKSFSIFENLQRKMSSTFTGKSEDGKMFDLLDQSDYKKIQSGINKSELQIKTHITTFNDLSIEEKLTLFKQKFYVTNKKESSSVILNSGLNLDKELKNIFKDLKEFFFFNVFQNKKIDTDLLGKNSMMGIKKSHDFYKTDNIFNVVIKNIFSSFEDSLETIGVPRLTKNLGREVNWTNRFADIMWKRVGMMTAAYLGYQAIDSFSDALIPDSVPIVGKGVTGTLATGVATTRVGLQYGINAVGISYLFKGLDSITNGAITNNSLTEWLTLDAEEMKDIFFHGKAVRVNKNRFWFTAGRQLGTGEEFDQYRPHVLYTMMNPTVSVNAMKNNYLGKWQKFFRKDFALTRYPWIMLDPYREERIAYKKYGAVYPVTEQLFKDIPVVGDFMSATIGNIIKPTQYVNENEWLIDGKYVLNPKYNPNDPSSSEYIEIVHTHGFKGIIPSIFGAVKDLSTMAGLRGYFFQKGTEFLFGKTNPYEKKVSLKSISDDISYQADYRKYNLGGFFDLTEPIRRILDEHNSLNLIEINPLRQKLPYWMPEYFKKGNNPALSYAFGTYIMPTEDFNKTMNHTGNDNLNRFRMLSLISPKSKEFEEMKNRVLNKIKDFTAEQKTHYYESLGYAEKFSTRLYANRYSKAPDIMEKEITIKEKLTPYEFIGTDNKRYKLDSVTTDFNKLSKIYGRSKARQLLSNLDSTFEENKTYKFKISKSANYAGGIDDEGDFFRIDSDLVNSKLNLDRSPYRFSKGGFLGKIFMKTFQSAPLAMSFEKLIGAKDVTEEWSGETVQSPYFRDWDSPISSFIEPFFTLSANSWKSAASLSLQANLMYGQSNSNFNYLNSLVKLGMAKGMLNKVIGDVSRSSEYEEETKVHDVIEQIKYINGKKSIYDLTGKEYLANLKKMTNEQDSMFLKDLLNVREESKRKEILKISNERLRTVLQMVWNRQQKNLTGDDKYPDWKLEKPETVNTYGVEYTNNQALLKNRIKSRLGYSFSKLDSKRQGIFNAYVGSEADEEFRYIKRHLIEQYNVVPKQVSSIYPEGRIIINGY